MFGVNGDVVRPGNVRGGRTHRIDLCRRDWNAPKIARRRVAHPHHRKACGVTVAPGGVGGIASRRAFAHVAHVRAQIVRRLDHRHAFAQCHAHMIARENRRIVTSGPVQVDAFDAPARKESPMLALFAALSLDPLLVHRHCAEPTLARSSSPPTPVPFSTNATPTTPSSPPQR